MTTTSTPFWAVAKIRDIPADVFFSKLRDLLEEAKSAYRISHQAFMMTHLPTFRDSARYQAGKIREYREIINKNLNLYYIIVGGNPHIGWPKGMSLN